MKLIWKLMTVLDREMLFGKDSTECEDTKELVSFKLL